MKKQFLFVLMAVLLTACSSSKNTSAPTGEGVVLSSNLSPTRYLHTSGLSFDFSSEEKATIYTPSGNSILCTYIYDNTRNEGRVFKTVDGAEVFTFKMYRDGETLKARQTGPLQTTVAQDFLNQSVTEYPSKIFITLTKQ